jgi:formylglycine-generating enzyme required for sulfatase activity
MTTNRNGEKTVKKAMKRVLGSFVACLALNALAADPTISDVTVRQRWPWSRLVDIDYVLSCDAAQSVDVVISAKDGETDLTLPSASLSGDLYSVSRGPCRIVWDPTRTSYTNSQMLTRFSVALTPTTVPLYMIVDLTKAAGADGQTAYVYESDLTNDLWGAWVRNPVTNNGTVVESVVWTGVTTNDSYKTDKLVLRRISAGTFKMGDSVPPTISTTLTKDFYAGVFEVTQRQWELIKGTGTKPSYFNNSTYYAARPVEQVTYDDIRGASNSVPSVNWPGTGVAVLPSSFVGLLRTKTGMADFDLPTEAQWECLCRAGTTTYYNDGIAGTPNTTSNAQMDVLGRYWYDGGKLFNGSAWLDPARGCALSNGTAIVGSYQANAWGLYDTHGNVWEWCLDWYADPLAAGPDPSGPVSGSYRSIRGANCVHPAGNCRSAYRVGVPSTLVNLGVGLRLVRTLP